MSTQPDMSAAAIVARLRLASALSDLHPDRRLDAKLDMSPSAITRRLREASDLFDLCRRLEIVAVESLGAMERTAEITGDISIPSSELADWSLK
jgi:hypothetical protein